MKKNWLLILSLVFALSLGLSACSCSEITDNESGGNSTSTGGDIVEKVELSMPENFIITDDYQASWSAVENAIGYAVKVDDGEYMNIGNVTSYDFSKIYGENISLKAVGDQEHYLDSNVVIDDLYNYTNVYADFEGFNNNDDWSATTLGATTIVGLSEKQSHSGSHSFKYMTNGTENYLNGIYLDSGYYGKINFSAIKTLDFWAYADNQDEEGLMAMETKLNEENGTQKKIYNPEVKNLKHLYSNHGLAFPGVFHMENGKEKEKLVNSFVPTKYEFNKWHQLTFDLSALSNISDFMLYSTNSQRNVIEGNNSWNLPSGYSYFIYYDDISVTYKTMQLDKPQNLIFDGNVLSWDGVDGATFYEVSLDGKTWNKVEDNSFTVENEYTHLEVRANNERKYPDGTKHYNVSDVAYFTKEDAQPLDISNIKVTLSKSKNALMNDTVTWTAVENADIYAVSIDNEKWEVVDGTQYDISDVTGTNKLYLKAISYRHDFKDSETKTIYIDKKVTIAGEDHSKEITINNKFNSNLSTTTEKKKYGNASIKIDVKHRDNDPVAIDYFYKHDNYKDNENKEIDINDMQFVSFWVYLDGDFDYFYTHEAVGMLYNWGSGIPGGGGDVKTPYKTKEWVQLVVNVDSLTSWVNTSLKAFRVMLRQVERTFVESSSAWNVHCPKDYTLYIDNVQIWYDDREKLAAPVLSVSKQADAVVNDQVNLEPVENAEKYQYSTNKKEWIDVNGTAVDTTCIYDTDKIYVRAVPSLSNEQYKEGVPAEIKIGKKRNLANEAWSGAITFNNRLNCKDSVSKDKKKYGNSSLKLDVKPANNGTKFVDFYFNKNSYGDINVDKIKSITMWVYIEADFNEIYTMEPIGVFYNWSSGISGSGCDIKAKYETNKWIQVKINMDALTSLDRIRVMGYMNGRGFEKESGNTSTVVPKTYSVYYDEIQLWYE